jgi:hypothetical protein
MKRLLAFYVFSSFLPALLFPQINITGRVVDSETKEAVSGVVIYTSDKNVVVITNEQGIYSLNTVSSQPVCIRHLAYNLLEIASDSLLNNPDIVLTRNIIELNEITVSPFHAKNVLEKAFKNSFNAFQKASKDLHLIHIDHQTSNGGKREAYALIETACSKSRNRKISWKSDLIQIDRLKNENGSNFYVNKNIIQPMSVEIFPSFIDFTPRYNKYTFELYENADKEFVIKASPTKPDKKYYRYYLFRIDKQDTILTEYTSQSYPNSSDLTNEKVYKGTKWQLVDHYTEIQFNYDDVSGKYCINGILNLGKYNVLSDVSAPHEGFFNVKSTRIKKIQEKLPEGIKIKPYDNILFESKIADCKAFWEKYVK